MRIWYWATITVTTGYPRSLIIPIQKNRREPFYNMISIPQTIHQQNTQSFILTHYTPKTGETSRIISRENIDNEMKKLLMINLLIEPHILYKDPSLNHHEPLCYTIPSLVQKN